MNFPGPVTDGFVPSISEARLDSSGARVMLAGFLLVVVVLVALAIGDAAAGAQWLAGFVLAMFALVALALLAEVLLRWRHLWRTRGSSLHYGVAVEDAAGTGAGTTGGGQVLLLRLALPRHRVRRATTILVRLQRHGGAAGHSDDGDEPVDADLEEWSTWATLPVGPQSVERGQGAVVRDLALPLPVRDVSARWRVIVEGLDDGEIEAYPIEPDAFGDGPASAWPALRQVPLSGALARDVEHADRGRIETSPLRLELLRAGPAAPVPELRASAVAAAGRSDDGWPWTAEIRLSRWRVGAVVLLALAAGLAQLSRTRWDSPDEWALPVAAASLSGSLALALIALHLAMKRWRWVVHAQGIEVHAGSPLWTNRRTVTPSDPWVMRRSSGSGADRRHELVVRRPEDAVVICPSLPGVARVQAVAGLLLAAMSGASASRVAGPGPGAVGGRGRGLVARWAWRLATFALALPLLGVVAGWSTGVLTTGEAGLPVPTDVAGLSSRWMHAARMMSPRGRDEARLIEHLMADDMDGVRDRLAAGVDPNLRLPDGRTLLMHAVSGKQDAAFDMLMSAGARVDEINETSATQRGDTALLLAMYYGRVDLARRLVAAGARLDVRNMWDWGPVHMASQRGCLACLEWLREADVPLHEPAGASRGETPLMLAAARGQVDALAWLVEHGGDLSRRDAHGQDALGWARFFRQPDTERWILARGQALPPTVTAPRLASTISGRVDRFRSPPALELPPSACPRCSPSR